MKNTILNFVLAGLWTITAIINIVNQANWIVIGYNIIITIYFFAIGLCQLIFDKRGDDGKIIMRKIYIAALIILFASIVVLTFVGLK